MDIVDPQKTELRVDLSVSDAITLRKDARVKFFPDGDPLDSREGIIVRPGYRAAMTADNKLAYRSYVRLEKSSKDPLRIGAWGTAKLYGEQAQLALYLLRRPIAAFRQKVGL